MSYVGNVQTTVLALPDNVTDVAFEPTGFARSLNFRSRGGSDIKMGTVVGGIAAGNYFTLTAGGVMSFSSHEQIGKLFFRSANAGGDTIELVYSDSLVNIGPLGYKP